MKNPTRFIPVNSSDRHFVRHRYVLWFGTTGTQYLLVWANNLEGAIDEAVDWLVDNSPGHIVDDLVAEEYRRAIAEGKDEETAMDEAESDCTIAGNRGNYILSYEWGIQFEDPSRADLLGIIYDLRSAA